MGVVFYMTKDQEKRVLLNLIDLCQEQANGKYNPEDFAHLVQGSLLGGTSENLTNIKWNRLVLSLQKLSQLQDSELKEVQARVLRKEIYQKILPDIHVAASDLDCFDEADEKIKTLFDAFGIKEKTKRPLRTQETIEIVKKRSLKKKIIGKISRLTVMLAKATLPDAETLEASKQEMMERLTGEFKSQLLTIDDLQGPPYEILDSDSAKVQGYKELLNVISHLQQAHNVLKNIESDTDSESYLAAFWEVKEAYDAFSNLSSNAQVIVEEFPDYFQEIKKGTDFINDHFSLEVPSFDVGDVIDALLENLSEPVARVLKGQKPPITSTENDAPQIAAIKELINATYQIQDAANLWRKGGLQNKTYAAWKAYKAYSAISSATPEMKTLINDNYAVFEPIISQAKGMFSGYDVNKLTDVKYLESVLGKNVGQMVNYLGPQHQKPNSVASLSIHIVNQLPNTIQALSQLVSGKEGIHYDFSLLNEDQIQYLGQNIDAFIKLTSNEQSTFNINPTIPLQNMGSLIKLQKILTELTKDGTSLSRESLERIVDWSENDLPDLLIWLDCVETELYLKQGTLTSAVQAPLVTLESLIDTRNLTTVANKVEKSVSGALINRDEILLKRVQASDNIQNQLRDDLQQIIAEKKRFNKYLSELVMPNMYMI